MYKAYRRSNAGDQPTPEKIGHEWTVEGPTGVGLWGLEFTDDELGFRKADAVALHLNTAFERGALSVQNAVRDALGLELL